LAKTKLKHNVVLAINTQEELNLLAEIEEGINKDCIYIDEPYVAFKDSDSVVTLMPTDDINDSFPLEFKNPRKLKPWYRKNYDSDLKKEN